MCLSSGPFTSSLFHFDIDKPPGIASIVISMWEKFGRPQYRPLRAGVFVALGLSGVVPAAHYILWEGFYHAWNMAAMGYLFLMAFLYIFGAFLYAARIPECIWPGKFDYLVSFGWFDGGEGCREWWFL